jgi:hypothetical protein
MLNGHLVDISLHRLAFAMMYYALNLFLCGTPRDLHACRFLQEEFKLEFEFEPRTFDQACLNNMANLHRWW